MGAVWACTSLSYTFTYKSVFLFLHSRKMPKISQLAELSAEKDEPLTRKIIEVVSPLFPENWLTWDVEEITTGDLLDPADPKMLNKLRFAIPTTKIAQIFGHDELPERLYNKTKRTLMTVPLARCLIYAPHALACRIHGEGVDRFLDTVRKIRPALVSQKVADEQLKRASTSPSKSSSTQAKRRRVSPSSSSSDEPESMSAQKCLVAAMSNQAEVLKGVMSILQTIAINTSAGVNQPTASQAGPSQVPSQHSLSRLNFSDDDGKDDDVEIAEADSSFSEEIELEERDQPEEAQPKPPPQQSFSLDFDAITVEAEPAIPKAKEEMARKGAELQRLGQSTWSSIRYKEAEKGMEATPVFSALKINPQLANRTPRVVKAETLIKFDQTLAVISHGLLQQRHAFLEGVKKLMEGSNSADQQVIQNTFLNKDCEFRRSSDQLIQYVFGRRADVLSQRRAFYTCPNAALNPILQDVPPSETHLYDQGKLAEVIKENGGIYKFFPTKNHGTEVATKRKVPTSTNHQPARSGQFDRAINKRPAKGPANPKSRQSAQHTSTKNKKNESRKRY